MHIGIAAPADTGSVVSLLGAAAESAPRGYFGAPFIGTLARALILRGHRVSLYTTDGELLRKTREPVVIEGSQLSMYFCPSRPRAIRPQNGMLGRVTDCFRFERQGLMQAIQRDSPDV